MYKRLYPNPNETSSSRTGTTEGESETLREMTEGESETLREMAEGESETLTYKEVGVSGPEVVATELEGTRGTEDMLLRVLARLRRA